MIGRSILSLCVAGAAAAAFSGAALAQAASVQAAIDNPARTDANVARDQERHASEVLNLVDPQPGDVVVDWIAGGGYWSELMAGMVGADGKVYATGARGDFSGYPNIETLTLDRGAPLPLDDDSVDVIMLSYVYHHMHFNADSGEATPPSTAATLDDFERVLKPGGKLVIIEHQAAKGTSREQSASWHRIAPETVAEDFGAHGFTMAKEDPSIFNNPDDDQKNYWRESGLDGKTTSLVEVWTADK